MHADPPRRAHDSDRADVTTKSGQSDKTAEKDLPIRSRKLILSYINKLPSPPPPRGARRIFDVGTTYAVGFVSSELN